MKIGKALILGFEGAEIPSWLEEFSARFGLGGVILFDYNNRKKLYENNILSPSQLRTLCKDIHNLPGKPFVCIDQEGGKVRRLKPKAGFADLPSQKEMAEIPTEKLKAMISTSYEELRELGVDINFAPVIDINYNTKNPDIGRLDRSFSDNPKIIYSITQLISGVAKKAGVALSLKHFPGLGGATSNTHNEPANISNSITEEQLSLFFELGKLSSNNTLLISHGIVDQWDEGTPCSLSRPATMKIRSLLPNTVLITDDLQMKAIQSLHSSKEATLKSLQAGIDLACLCNSLLSQEDSMMELGDFLTHHLKKSAELQEIRGNSQKRILRLKESITRKH